MSQKFKKLQNTNDDSTAFGKWFATAVYDQHFIETEQLADFIQTQASVKKSDIKAVLDELGIFKVGFSSIGTEKPEDLGAQNITTRRVLFSPETARVVTGTTRRADGTVIQKFAVAKNLVKDVVFEEAKEYNAESSSSGGSGEGGN